MKKDQNIDELFREKLLNLEQEPPAYLLDHILSGVAANRRKKRMLYWRVAGVAAGLLLAFVAGWQINNFDGNQSNQNIRIVQSEIGKTEKETAAQLAETSSSQDENANPTPERSDVGNAGHNKLVTGQHVGQQSFSKNAAYEKVQDVERIHLKVIKRLEDRLNSVSNSTAALKEMSTLEKEAEPEEQTIDQQIMKQNQEMLLVQKDGKEKARWIVGAMVSPVYNVSRSSHTQAYASNMLNSSNSNPVDLGGGISVEVKTGKRWSLQSGVYYSALEQSSSNSSVSSQQDYMFADASAGKNFFNTKVSIDAGNNKLLMNSTAGVIELNSIPSGIEIGTNLEDKALAPAVIVSDAKFIQNFEYIEIPVYLRYTVIDSRFDVEMVGGFSSNLLVGNQTFMETGSANNLVGRTKDMQTVNYSGTVGLGLKYNLTKNLFLNVEPRIKYYLNSLNNSAAVTYKPYTIGVFSGLSYQF